MKDFENQKSRRHPTHNTIRIFETGTLLVRRSNHLIVLFSLLLTFPAFLVSSCVKAPLESSTQTPTTPTSEEEKADSVTTSIRLRPSSSCKIERLDIFVYSSSGAESLECYIKRDFPEDSLIEIKTLEGDKTVSVIANSTKEFSLKALQRHDSMSSLSYSFEDNKPEAPLMSGEGVSSGGSVEVTLTPLMCTVELSEITNLLAGYELLESPRIRLGNINAEAKIMQQKDFHPSEILDYGVWAALPCDVGMHPQEPHTELFCFPNSSSDDNSSGGGYLKSFIELECVIEGSKHKFRHTLPSLERGGRVEVSLTVEEDLSFSGSP